MNSDACCSNPDVHCTRWCAECGTTLESGCPETDADPAPVPARVLLPAPEWRDPRDETRADWRLSNDCVVCADRGGVYGLGPDDLDSIEHDALAALAAVHWARGAL